MRIIPHHATTTRRFFLTGVGSFVGSFGVAPAFILRPAAATPASMAAAIHEVVGQAAVRQGKVKLDIPPLVENGNAVSLTVSVDSPMTEQDYVKRIHLFAESNPQPRVLDVELGPYNGRARVTTRIRVAISQQVHAIAVMSDDSLWSVAVDVEITVGGCAP